MESSFTISLTDWEMLSSDQGIFLRRFSTPSLQWRSITSKPGGIELLLVAEDMPQKPEDNSIKLLDVKFTISSSNYCFQPLKQFL